MIVTIFNKDTKRSFYGDAANVYTWTDDEGSHFIHVIWEMWDGKVRHSNYPCDDYYLQSVEVE